MGVESIVIVKNGDLGFVASLRFEDSTRDCDIAHTDKQKLYKMINYTVRQGGHVSE
jgi:hypothetical protein